MKIEIKSRWRRFFAVSSAMIVLLGAFIFIKREQILIAIGNWLIAQDKLQSVNVIHVIAGDDYRTEYAIQLYKQGYAEYIFFTGGWCQIHDYYHGVHGQELALSLGIPKDAIAFDDSSVTSTYSETVLLKSWIDKSPIPIHSVMVVSDPFHMRRSQWTYRKVLGKGTEVLMAPVPFEQTPYQRRWWTDSVSQRYVRDEYEKFVYYILRYQLSWGWIKNWLASLDTV